MTNKYSGAALSIHANKVLLDLMVKQAKNLMIYGDSFVSVYVPPAEEMTLNINFEFTQPKPVKKFPLGQRRFRSA